MGARWSAGILVWAFATTTVAGQIFNEKPSPSGQLSAPAEPAPKPKAPEAVLAEVEAKIKAAGVMPNPLSVEHANLLHLKAVALARLSEPAKARQAMARVLTVKTTNRAVIFNAAKLDIMPGGNPMRAAVALEQWMNANGTSEEALNCSVPRSTKRPRSKRSLRRRSRCTSDLRTSWN